MAEEFIILLLMLGIIAIASFIFKNEYSKLAPIIFLAAGVGALAARMGFRIRELVEGPFAYLDTILGVMMGMLFVMMLISNGTLELYFNKIISKKRNNFTKGLLMVLFVALPGIFTGTATACIFTTGLIVGKYLIEKGVEKYKVIEFVSVSSLIGMILPPISLPTMITVVSRSGSYPATYEGYALSLLIAALPALLLYSSVTGKWLGNLDIENRENNKTSKLYNIPIIVVAILLFSHNFLYKFMPFLGYPLIFTIGSILAVLMPAKKFNVIESAGKGINIIGPVVAITFAIGSALEILTLVGLSGRLATIFYTSNAILLTLASIFVIIVSGIFIGGPFSFLVTVISSYVIGSTMYMGNELLLTATSLALCLGIFLPIRGGFISIAAKALGIEEIDYKKVIGGSAFPVGLILAMAIIFTLAYDKLLFLFI